MIVYSPYIYQLARALRGFGWRVSLYNELRDSHGQRYSGRCSHERQTVEVGCSSAYETLLVLAHEAGHVLAAARWGDPYHRLSVTRRERTAYLYGWGVLKVLGAPVTRAEWRTHHSDIWDEINGQERADAVA